MNVTQLINELDRMRVPKSFYSINDGLKTDAYILNYVYGRWEYFYFDEKGNRLDEKNFLNEEEAVEFFLKRIRSERKEQRK